MNQIPADCLYAIREMLELEDNSRDGLIKTYYSSMSSKVANHIGRPSVPDDLKWLVREVTVRRYNLTGQESTVQDTVPGSSSTFRLDPMQDFYDDLDRYVERRDSKRRVRMF